MTVTVTGNAFGNPAPDPQTLTGTFDATGVHVSTTLPFLGALSVSLGLEGAVTGSAAPPGFDSMTIGGTWTARNMRLTYRLTRDGSEYAAGRADLLKE